MLQGLQGVLLMRHISHTVYCLDKTVESIAAAGPHVRTLHARPDTLDACLHGSPLRSHS